MPESNNYIFISYARRDGRDLALRLHADLQAADHTVWLDTSDIGGGASWSAEIECAIERCDVTLALLSAGSYESEICRAEHLRALRKDKRVIPLLVQPDAERPLYFEHLNYRDFSDAAAYGDMLQTLLNDIASGEHTPLPAYRRQTRVTNAPAAPPHFLDRPDVLDRLRDAVTSDASDRRIGITAIQGMGGIGKSVMAAALCRDEVIQDAYPDGIVWVTIGQNPGSLLLKLRGLLEALGEPVASNATEEQMIDKLRTTLPQKAALIVLDDVWNHAHIAPFIVEDASASRLLFTTRDASLITAVGANEQRLDALDNDQARTLLADWAGAAQDTLPDEVEQVMHECGNLPLALALCGALVRDGETWADVLDALREADLEYLDHPHGSVMKSLKISIDALEREQPDYARHYLELAVFPDDVAVPEEAVLTLWLHTNGINERRARRLINLLASKALVTVSGESPQRTLELHDIQHLYLRNVLENLDAAHQELLDAYRAKCADGWHTGPNDGYFFEHLAYHLNAAGRKEELYNLLTESAPDGGPNPWMEAKFAACVGDTSYAADLALALSDFADPLEPEQLLIVAQLHTARQVVNARVSSYTDTDLKTLVWLDREQEALSHARLRSETHDQFKGLMTIYETKNQKMRADLALLDECRILANGIQNEKQWTKALVNSSDRTLNK
jgi:hypothetical protein